MKHKIALYENFNSEYEIVVIKDKVFKDEWNDDNESLEQLFEGPGGTFDSLTELCI